MKNRRILLVSRPEGWPTEANFRLEETPVAKPADGQFLVRNHWLSLDPYMRGRMDAAKSYAKYVELGEVMTGGTVGEVIESRHPGFKAGEFVNGALGWQDYAVTDGAGVRKVDGSKAPLSYYLGVLGMPGVTAWVGLLDIAQPKAGETVVVSAASGAVGSVVGQIAKIKGCRAVGIAGGAEKCGYVTGRARLRRLRRSSRRATLRGPAGRRAEGHRRRLRERRRAGARRGAPADEPVRADHDLRPDLAVQRDRALRHPEPALGTDEPAPHAGVHRERPDGAVAARARRSRRSGSRTGRSSTARPSRTASRTRRRRSSGCCAARTSGSSSSS